MSYKITERKSFIVNNTGSIISCSLYISTRKGSRRKWAGERFSLADIDILIRQNYLDKGFAYISANIVIKYSTGQNLLERIYKLDI